jgi:hypothetical protein
MNRGPVGPASWNGDQARYPFLMPAGRASDDSEGIPPKLSLWQRTLLALPRMKHVGKEAPLKERLRDAVVKPARPGEASNSKGSDGPKSVDELETAARTLDDKERLIGVLAAPLAAIITVVVIANLIANDPVARLKNGSLNPRHVSVSLYHELAGVLVALTVLILIMTLLRKRMFLGLAMALFGLAVFDLHGFGFGIPFILGGSWYLVRAYRIHQDQLVATGVKSARPSSPRKSGGAVGRGLPNKRYTPPTPAPARPRRMSARRTPKEPGKEQKAG